MDFDSILEDWENRKDRRDTSRVKPPVEDDPPQVSGGFSDEILDRYLPGSEVVKSRDTVVRKPVAEGRSIWLKRPIQDTLDLHGLNGREAREELARFIRTMRRRGFRKGLVIHGKGLHSPEGSVLAPLVKEYMEMSCEIGEFGRAARKDGGSGATWFLLRQRSR